MSAAERKRRERLLIALAKAGATLMCDGDQHEVLAVRSDKLETFVARIEREALHRFFSLSAEARSQALHLHATRDNYVLREYVTQQQYAGALSLDEVEHWLEKRKADQSPELVRLRELASRA